MGADYRNFKTPFYEISVSDASGKRSVKLPHHIIRLVEKIEIMETFVAGQFTTFNIDIVEGSREPASPDASLGTSGLYKVTTDGKTTDLDISGSITNRSGSITDLRFSGSGGITFLTEQERKQGKVDNTPQKNVDGDIVTRSYKTEAKAPVFLFQQRNKVSITWGYVEDPSSRRTITGYIYMLKTSFSESGPTRTTITCQDTRAGMDQIARTKGKTFGTRVKTGKGNSIINFEDKKLEKMIRDICDSAGMAHIVSENFEGDSVDKDKQKLWIGGESFHQFMTRLAALHNSYYTIVPGKDTNKDTLVFIKKTDFESRLVITDTELTTFKGPNSILKSVDINCDFGVPVGNMQSNTGKDGKQKGVVNNKSNSVLFTNEEGQVEKIASNSPATDDNPIPAVKMLSDNVADGNVTGTVDINPSGSTERLENQAGNVSDNKSRIIQLEFVSLGYTKYTPGVIDIRNLGVRYSGKYRLQTVTHTVDSSGYVTKGTALSMAVGSGGVTAAENPKAPVEPKKTDVKQFKPAKEKVDTASTITKYHKVIGIV